MIDIESETLVPVGDVPRSLPPRRSGRPLHVSTVYRWILRGVRGIRLEAIRIGGTTYTTVEAIQRFSDRLTTPAVSGSVITPVTISARRKQIKDAAMHAAAILAGRDTHCGHERTAMGRCTLSRPRSEPALGHRPEGIQSNTQHHSRVDGPP